MEFQLTNPNWKWFHYNNHEWKHVINCDNLEDRKKLFLMPCPGANSIESNPLSKILEYEQIAPSKDNCVLFQKFINLDGSTESFIEFANKSGHLALVDFVSINNGKEQIATSSLDFWKNEHWLFKITYKLWEALSANNESELLKIIKISPFEKKGEKAVAFVLVIEDYNSLNPGKAVNLFSFPGTDFPTLTLSTTSSNDPICIGVTVKMSPRTSQMTLRDIGQWFLLWITNGQMKLYPTLAQLEYQKGNLKQNFRPENLLAAMWFQFFQVITGERRIQQCAICGQWADITSMKKGKEPWSKHRECANWDRVTKSRKLPEINRLISVGKTIAEVADILNIKVQDILRWKGE